MSKGRREVEAIAEEAVRHADGDWIHANESFRQSIEDDAELKEALLAISVARQLRQAARRLGETIRACPFCAEHIALDAVKCPHCGEWLTPDRPQSAPQPPPRPAQAAPIIRHFTLLTSWVLIILIVILIFTFFRGA